MPLVDDDLAQELDSPIGLTGLNRAGLGDNFDDKGPGYAYQPSFGAAFVSVGGRTEMSALATGGAGTSGNPWTGWESAFNAQPIAAHIHFSAGYYTRAVRLDAKDKQTITGDGKSCTFILSSVTGSSFRVGTSVSSAIGNILIAGFTIQNTNALNTGSGILALSTWKWAIRDLKVIGHRYGISHINTLVFDMIDSDLESQLVAGEWFVGTGDYNLTYADEDHSAYAGGGNNVIAHMNVQFEGTTTLLAIDGGYNYRFVSCNFNGGTNAIRIAHATSAWFNAGIESQTEDCVKCADTSFRAGTAIGDNGEVVFEHCNIIPNASKRAIDCDQTRSLILNYNRIETGNPWLRNEAGTTVIINRSLRVGAGAPFSGTPASYVDLGSDDANRSLRTSLRLETEGGVRIKTGANKTMGSAVLVGGTVTVNNTTVTANSILFLTRSATGGTVGHLSYTISAGASFTINSSSATDTSTINWLLVEPMA